MGNESPDVQNETNVPKKSKKNDNIKNGKNNQLVKQKEEKEDIDPKDVINTIMTNIKHNTEYDIIEELELDYLDEYIDSIFPDDFPKENIDLIRRQMHEIVNYKIGEENKIKNMYELKQINNQNCFYFICSMKKITENTANIAYKFQIIDIKIKNPAIKPKEIIENQENQIIIKNVINQEYMLLNGKV